LVRYSLALLGALIGLWLLPANAERWLRSVANEKPQAGAYNWFDVDSVVRDKKSGLVVVHAAVATVNAVRGGKIEAWKMWGFDCKAQKAFTIGATGTDGKFALTANWKTDPKAVVPLGAGPSAPATQALATKLCAWIDSWPQGALR
jgi:hypothetical protein